MSARIIEKIAIALLGLATALVVAPLALILLVLVWKGISGLSWELLSDVPRAGFSGGGIMPAIVGSFLLVLGTSLIAIPLGIGAAVYLNEYARDTRLTRIVRLAILNLAGVPSIVHGLFGLSLFVLFLHMGLSLAAASCTLAVLVLPTVITASEEALRTVPDSLREASEGLGATRTQTVIRVVLPSALPGILTGTILATGRAAGETAPIMFTGVFAYNTNLPHGPGDGFMALPYLLYTLSNTPAAPEAMPYATALVLMAVVLGTSALAIVLRARFRARNHA